MKKIIGLLMVCALFGMILMGCQNAASGSDTRKFEGRWKSSLENSESTFTFSGNSFVNAHMRGANWSAIKGTFTFTDTEITMTPTHRSPRGTTNPTEAVAIAAMIAAPDPEMGASYTLNTTPVS